MEVNPFIIGIAGGTGSGKTELATRIKESFGDDVTILTHDFYYHSYDQITFEERKQRNYDCPEAYDTELLIKDVKKLKKGEHIERPDYSYTTRLREDYTVRSESN